MAAAPIFLTTGETFGDTDTINLGGTLSGANTRGADGFITGGGVTISDATINNLTTTYEYSFIYITVDTGAIITYRIDKLGNAEFINADSVSRDENGNLRIPVKDSSIIQWTGEMFDITGDRVSENISASVSVSVMYP